MLKAIGACLSQEGAIEEGLLDYGIPGTRTQHT